MRTLEQPEPSTTRTWSAVGSMALCVALLIASEFMPVRLMGRCGRDDRLGCGKFRDSGRVGNVALTKHQRRTGSGGGLMVGAIQLSIMLGATIGGLILDRFSIAATFVFGTVMLVLATVIIGDGKRLMPAEGRPSDTELRESEAMSPSATFA